MYFMFKKKMPRKIIISTDLLIELNFNKKMFFSNKNDFNQVLLCNL